MQVSCHRTKYISKKTVKCCIKNIVKCGWFCWQSTYRKNIVDIAFLKFLFKLHSNAQYKKPLEVILFQEKWSTISCFELSIFSQITEFLRYELNNNTKFPNLSHIFMISRRFSEIELLVNFQFFLTKIVICSFFFQRN